MARSSGGVRDLEENLSIDILASSLQAKRHENVIGSFSGWKVVSRTCQGDKFCATRLLKQPTGRTASAFSDRSTRAE